MVEAEGNEAFMYENCEAGFSSHRIVKRVDRQIYDWQYRHGGIILITYYLQHNLSTDTY